MTERTARFDPTHRSALLGVARESLEHGFQHNAALTVVPQNYDSPLREIGASFVTLQLEGKLRGCIGSLRATQPLVQDVAEHAFAAGFEDPRFEPLAADELDRLSIEISVLSPMEPLHADSEETLVQQLRPKVDGLVMSSGRHRATFLPAVWQQLEDPYVFLSQLRHKAGLPLDFWSADLNFQRYTTESFHG